MIDELKPSDRIAHTNFAVDMLEGIDTLPDFLCQAYFSDEVMFHVNSCKQVKLQDLGQSKSTCHMRVGKRQPQSKRVGWLNVQQVDWTISLFRKDCDLTLYLDMLELYGLHQLPP
jgi:hypothetical protein